MSDDRLPNRWLGFFMIAIGGIITALCGSCTFSLAGPTIWEAVTNTRHQATEQDAWASMTLIVGGLPTIAGLVLLVWGLRLTGLFGKSGKNPPNKA